MGLSRFGLYSEAVLSIPLMFHRVREFLCRQSIQDIALGKPGAAGLQNALANFIQVRGVMGISIDDDLYAALLRLPEMHIVEIQTIRVRIQFHCDLMFCGSGEDRVHVELGALTAEVNGARGE